MISEVADQGTSDGTCDGDDWVELHNVGDTAASLDGLVLHDDKGADDEDARVFSAGSATIDADGYLVLCQGVDFEFKIGGDDTVTLLEADGVTVLSSMGPLGDDGAEDQTTVRRDDGSYGYTQTPTPGAAAAAAEPPSASPSSPPPVPPPPVSPICANMGQYGAREVTEECQDHDGNECDGTAYDVTECDARRATCEHHKMERGDGTVSPCEWIVSGGGWRCMAGYQDRYGCPPPPPSASPSPPLPSPPLPSPPPPSPPQPSPPPPSSPPVSYTHLTLPTILLV